MERKRILELALETLERQKADVDAVIAEIRQLEGAKQRIIAKKSIMPAFLVVKRRSKTKAEKKALSLKMKQVWAKKKAEAAQKAAKQHPKA